MYVRVDVDAGRSELCQADDLTQLHVEVVGGGTEPDAAVVGPALGDFGRLDGEHAWLRIEVLRTAGPANEDWQQQFDGMIDYARSKGWTDGSGAVRAHLEHGDR